MGKIINALKWLNAKRQRFCHDKLDWGYPKKGIEDFDGVNCHATCRLCGGRLLMDSNGDWFHA